MVNTLSSSGQAPVNLCKRREPEQAQGAERPTRPARLDQKVRGQEQAVTGRLSQTEHLRRRGGTQPAQVHKRNVVSP